MKAIEQLSNVEKAKLLHQLFPRQMPGLVRFIQNMAKSVREAPETYRSAWDCKLLSFEEALQFSKDVDNKIYQYGTKLHKDHRLFALHLFYEDHVAFVIYCMMTYISVRQHDNRKFVLAIDLLFNP